jgi:hypothetical protein
MAVNDFDLARVACVGHLRTSVAAGVANVAGLGASILFAIYDPGATNSSSQSMDDAAVAL